MFQRIGFLSALAVIALTGLASRAEGATFTVQGQFSDGSSLSGTAIIDTTFGVFTTISMTVGPPNRLLSDVVLQKEDIAPYFYSVTVQDADGTEAFIFGIPQLKLINYVGGPICSLATPDCNYSNLWDLKLDAIGPALVTGSLIATETTQTTTPEPAPVAIMGFSLAAVWTISRRRQQDVLR